MTLTKVVPDYSRLGYALAAKVLQSDLYGQLDDVERAQCDELLAAAPDAAEQRTAAQCGAQAEGGKCVLPKGHNMGRLDIPSNHKAVSAPLSREQIEGHKRFIGMGAKTDPDFERKLCDMALRYRDVLEQEPVAWRYKPKSGEKWWLTGGPPEGVDGWDIEKLIVAPVAQVPGVAG